MRLHRLMPLALAVATVAGAAASTPAEKPVLPWIEDDYPGALSEARARNLPIFVEVWAPW